MSELDLRAKAGGAGIIMVFIFGGVLVFLKYGFVGLMYAGLTVGFMLIAAACLP